MNANNDSKRAQYIKENYKIEQTAEGFRAVSLYQGKVFSEYTRATRADVIRLARCNWGHFNHQDEADAFSEIFR